MFYMIEYEYNKPNFKDDGVLCEIIEQNKSVE